MKTFSLSTSLSRALLVALASGLVAGAAIAQDFRIGAVNVDRIMLEANLAKAAQTKLEQEFSRREKDVQGLAASLKAASDKFEREAPTLPESQRVTRQRQLVDMDRDFQRKRSEFQEDLARRKSEELQQVLERTNRAIKQVAEAEKFDLIVQEAAYINPRIDITDKVLNTLNNLK